MVSTRGKKRSREGHEEPTDAPTPKRATRQASSRQSTASPSRQTSGVVTRAQSASRSTQFSSSSAKKALPVRTNRVVTRSQSASRSRQSTPQPSSTSSHVVTRARAACGASSPAPQVVLSSATSEPSNVADQHDEAEHEDEDNDEDDDEYENEETDTESPTRSGSDSGANDKTEEQPPKKRKVGNRGPRGPKKGFELRKDSTGAVRAHYDDTLDWIGAQQNGGIPPKIRKRVEVDYYLFVLGLGVAGSPGQDKGQRCDRCRARGKAGKDCRLTNEYACKFCMEDGQLCSITDRMRMTTQFKKRNPDIPLKAHKGEPLRLFSIYSPEAARVRALSVARIPPPDTLPPPAPTEAPDEIELTDEQARAMGLRPVRPRGRPPRGYLPSQHQRQTYRPYTAENIDIHVPSRPPPTKPGRPGTNADAGAQLPEPPADATPEQLIAFYKDLVARLAHDLAQARARADVAESTLKRRRESDADEQADRETLQADQSSDNHRDDATDAVQDDQPRPPKRSRTEQDFTRIPPQPWVEELRRKHQEDGKRFGARDAWLHARAHNEAHEDDPTQRIDDDPSAISKALGTGTKLTGWVACDHCRVNGKGCGKGREVKCERCINMDLKCTYTHPKTLETIERFPAPAPVDQASGASTAPEQPVAPTNPPHPMPPSATSYIEGPPVAQMDAAIKVFESSQYTEADIATGMNTDIPDAPDLGQFDVQPVQPRTRNGGLAPGGNTQYAGVPPLAPPQSTPTANPDYSILAGSGFTNVFDDQLIPQSLPHPAQPNTFQQGNLGNYAPNGFRPRAPGPTNLLRLPSPTESSFLSSSSLETPSTGSFAMSFTEMLGSDALDWDGGFTNNGYHDDFSQFIDPNAGVPNQGVFQN